MEQLPAERRVLVVQHHRTEQRDRPLGLQGGQRPDRGTPLVRFGRFQAPEIPPFGNGVPEKRAEEHQQDQDASHRADCDPFTVRSPHMVMIGALRRRRIVSRRSFSIVPGDLARRASTGKVETLNEFGSSGRGIDCVIEGWHWARRRISGDRS
jgi:hypothetical protein